MKQFIYLIILFSSLSLFANHDKSIQVVGEGKAYVVPDQARVQLTTEFTSNSTEVARSKVNENIKKVKRILTKYGVDKKHLKTTQLSIHPQYDYIKGKRRFKGYQVRQSLSVFFDKLKALGPALDKVSLIDGIQVGSLNMTSSQYEVQKLKAFKSAGAEALKKAQSIASGLNVGLGSVLSAVEGHSIGSSPRPRARHAKMMSMDSMSAPTQIEAGQMEIKAHITVEYKIK